MKVQVQTAIAVTMVTFLMACNTNRQTSSKKDEAPATIATKDAQAAESAQDPNPEQGKNDQPKTTGDADESSSAPVETSASSILGSCTWLSEDNTTVCEEFYPNGGFSDIDSVEAECVPTEPDEHTVWMTSGCQIQEHSLTSYCYLDMSSEYEGVDRRTYNSADISNLEVLEFLRSSCEDSANSMATTEFVEL